VGILVKNTVNRRNHGPVNTVPIHLFHQRLGRIVPQLAEGPVSNIGVNVNNHFRPILPGHLQNAL
jgi:hypothetical protein